MFGWFKRKPKGCQANHFKEAGQPTAKEMYEVIRLDSIRSASDRLAYSIWQCSECGVRAFMAPYAFIYPKNVTRAVDEFINKEISLAELKARLDFGKMIYEVTSTKETNDTTKAGAPADLMRDEGY